MLVPLVALSVLAAAPAPRAPAYAQLFDDTKVHTIDLYVRSEKDYAQLDVEPFTWVRADVALDGARVADVGLRRKGESRQVTGSEKTPFKIAFGELRKGQRYLGLDRVVLNTSRYDPSFVREVLAYELLRGAGCPAPRAAHATVTLHVAGRSAPELLGLYVLVEDVRKPFLDERFGGHDGALFEVKSNGDLFAVGRPPDAIERGTDLKDASHHPQARPRLDALIAAVQRGGPDLEAALDVDLFLRCLAVTTAVVSLDSYQGTGHNFYLYDDPVRGRFVYLPWDFDQSFGTFINGPAESVIDWSVARPTLQGKLLVEQVLAVPAHRTRYAELLRDLATGPFSPFAMSSRVERLERLLAGAVARDPHRDYAADTFPRALHEDLQADRRLTFPFVFGILPFVEARSRSIIEQLVGLRSGAHLSSM